MSLTVQLVTFRGQHPATFRALCIESENVLAALGDVSLFDARQERPIPRWRIRLDQRWPALSERLPPRRFTDPPRTFDLLLVQAVGLAELGSLIPLRGLLRRAGRSACWVHELWAHNLSQRIGEMRWLRQFDALFVGLENSAAPLAAATGRPTAYLPHAVDCLAWAPPASPPPRVIDVFWYGRRVESTHEALHALARKHGLFYLFDTVQPGKPYDLGVHRQAMINLAQRTRLMFVTPAKAGDPNQTRGQMEIGYRFMEAAAAGAVMIGGRPTAPAWDRFFNWPGAIEELPVGTTEVENAVLGLLGDEAERERRSRRACAEALRRLDIAYRWQDILKHFGLPTSVALQQRRATLATRAAEFDAPVSAGGGALVGAL